jgi:hypothetical protein
MVAIILLLVVSIGVTAMNVFVLLSRRQRRRVSRPSCGKCGYAVRGLPTFICPECGSDLREVGILTPG